METTVMAHEVESMFYVNEVPWHGLGVPLENPPTVADAIRAAGLDWSVTLKRVVTIDGAEVPGARATVRESDGRVLGCVGTSYTPLQNAEAFSFFDPFLAAGEASLETAGSLREGSRIWILAKLNRQPSVIVKGDEVNKYILLANAHDGSLTARVGFVPIRVVCANTLALAEGARASKLIRVRHQKNIHDSLTQIRDIMNTANASFEATAEQYRRLARTAIVEDDLKRYVRAVFSWRQSPSTALAVAAPVIEGELLEDAEDTRKSRSYDIIKRLFESGRGNDLPRVRGTLWAAYNAVTEYLAYERGGSQDTRVDSVWFAGGAKLNQHALDAAMAMAA
jgi:phage/plasmid-like protein (TIGR03299 family)